MPDASDQKITAAQAAAALVLETAPLLRSAYRLPTYPKPALTWQLSSRCDPAFVAGLRAAWDRLDLRDPAQFSEAEALIFRYVRMHGIRKLYRLRLPGGARYASDAWHQQQGDRLVWRLGTLLGEKLLALLSPADRARWFPMHGVNFILRHDDRTLTLCGDALDTLTSSRGQPIYCAPQRPTVLVQGVQRPVAFTAHALQRMRDRLVAVPHSFDSQYDVFSYVQHCQYFEPATVHRDQPAVALFDGCTPGFFVHRYVEALLGLGHEVPGYAYRLGYCPLVPDGDVWLAPTLLFPGFIGTPEYQVLWHASLDRGVRERMLAACEDLSYAHLAATDDFSLLRWFHTHGVPQVIPAPAGLLVVDLPS
jgi:hypothetical protein